MKYVSSSFSKLGHFIKYSDKKFPVFTKGLFSSLAASFILALIGHSEIIPIIAPVIFIVAGVGGTYPEI